MILTLEQDLSSSLCFFFLLVFLLFRFYGHPILFYFGSLHLQVSLYYKSLSFLGFVFQYCFGIFYFFQCTLGKYVQAITVYFLQIPRRTVKNVIYIRCGLFPVFGMFVRHVTSRLNLTGCGWSNRINWRRNFCFSCKQLRCTHTVQRPNAAMSQTNDDVAFARQLLQTQAGRVLFISVHF